MVKPKARIGIKVKEAFVGSAKSANRSADLDDLTHKYKILRSKMKGLITSLRNNHAAMIHLSRTRVEVADHCAHIAEQSALHQCTAELPTDETPPGSIVSYRSVHHDLTKRTESYAKKYTQFIIDYAVEWDAVLDKRVSVGLLEAERLRRDLDHYQGKVESMRQTTNQALSKGKQVDSKTAEKLGRNEEKLIKAKEMYNKFSTDMCVLVEEVTNRSWKDLHPMLVKLAQFDATMSSDESNVLSNMNEVVDQLKRVAEKYGGLTPQGRIRDIAEKQPNLLSSGGSQYQKQIEAGSPMGGSAGSPIGGAPSSFSSNMYDQPLMAPGSVAPQGMGGFPVAVAAPDASSTALSRSSSYTSYSSMNEVPSTSEMLKAAAAAAPPPSWEQVNDAGSAQPRTRTNSGNYPPKAPSSGNAFSRNSSFGSGSYGAMPAAPPPPPPALSGLSMYDSNPPVATAIPAFTADPAPDPPSHSSYNEPPAHPLWSRGGSTSSSTYDAPSQSPKNPFDREF